MIEEIFSPLTHIIRNCIDHGIEPAEIRTQKSKPSAGTIKIKTENKGDNILINISDDGAGLNQKKIKEKALEKNIINYETAERMSDNMIYNLIFHPGFSTAEKVTEISGRGVGMDVVKKSVEKLGGRIEIETAENKGTQFKIILPLATSIIDGLITEISNAKIIFSILKIKFTLTLNKTNINHTFNKDKGFIVFQERSVPVIDLDDYYKFDSNLNVEKNNLKMNIKNILTTKNHNSSDIDSQHNEMLEKTALIIEHNGSDYALLVNHIIGKEKIVSKKICDNLRKIRGLKAGTILGDGSIGFIIEPNEIIENYALN